MIKAIIFDMDGVLIDAREWHYHALNKALSLFGFEINRNDHLNIYDGLPTKQKLQLLSNEINLPTSLHNFINQIKQIYTMEMAYTQCKPIFTHQYSLSRLKQDGYKLALCSNSIRDTIDLMMLKSDLKKYLEFYISNQEVDKPKPHPEIYLKAIQKLALKPQECLILEDNINGVKAALASGAHLLEIKDLFVDVSYENIKNKIMEINQL